MQVRLGVYLHRLASAGAIVDRARGTLLTWYRARLAAPRFDRFLARCRERLLPQLGPATPHLFPFKRVLFCARRPPAP